MLDLCGFRLIAAAALEGGREGGDDHPRVPAQTARLAPDRRVRARGGYAATAFLPLRAGFAASSTGFGAVRNSTFPTTL